MNPSESLPLPSTKVELFYREAGKKDTPIEEGKNMHYKKGMEVIARSLYGDLRVNGAYFCYSNSAYTPPANNTDKDVTYYRTTASTADRGVLRVPLAVKPTSSDSGPLYTNNVANFLALTSEQAPIVTTGSNSVVRGTSSIYEIALVAMDPQDPAKDIVLSGFIPATQAVYITGPEVGFLWSQIFEV